MKAFDKFSNIVDVEVIGEREIYLDGKRFTGYYIDLPRDMQRYLERVEDDLYDLPCFQDGYIYASYNRFTARAAARLIEW